MIFWRSRSPFGCFFDFCRIPFISLDIDLPLIEELEREDSTQMSSRQHSTQRLDSEPAPLNINNNNQRKSSIEVQKQPIILFSRAKKMSPSLTKQKKRAYSEPVCSIQGNSIFDFVKAMN